MTPRLAECVRCEVYALGTPWLVEACATVAISRGQTTEQTMRQFLRAFHDRGHRT